MGRAGSLVVPDSAHRIRPVVRLVATGQPLSDIQQALLSAYRIRRAVRASISATAAPRASKATGADVSVNYNIPVAKQLKPFFKLDIFNVLNKSPTASWNSTVSPDPNSPVDALGLATGYIQGSRFGTGTSNANYPQSTVGTGLRGFRMSFGIQF
jgi:hypothetical protein